jgi:exonuclease III
MRMPRVLDFLEQHEPDLVFMQETKSEPDGFPLLELEAAPKGAQAVRPRTAAMRAAAPGAEALPTAARW